MSTSEAQSDVALFEDERWRTFTQKEEFRHTACTDLITEGTVLDIGCGDGLLLGLLKNKNIIAKGIDISQEAVERCRAQGLDAELFDPLKPLPFPDNSFDTVTLLDVLEHVYDPVAVLREASRVSRKTVIIGVPNFSSLPSRIQVLTGAVPENNRPQKGHLYWFNWNVLTKITKEASLMQTDMKMNTFRPITFVEKLVTQFPNVCALSFVGKYEKKL